MLKFINTLLLFIFTAELEPPQGDIYTFILSRREMIEEIYTWLKQ